MTDHGSRTVSDIIRSFFLRLFSPRVFSRLFGKLADIRRPRTLVRWIIRRYIRMFDIETHELELDPMAYPSLGDFFIRRLKPEARPVDHTPAHVVSPVDALVMTAGSIDTNGTALQIKGSAYPIGALLPEPDLAGEYQGGTWIQLYLSPRDYHRSHFPVTGAITRAWYEPGRLYPVNQFSLQSFPGVLARNERILLQLNDGRHTFAMALVGALNVGRIGLTVSTFETNRGGRRQACPVPLERDSGVIGEELGYFRMGSTVVLFFRPGAFDPSVNAGDRIQMGQRIGTWR